MFFSAEMLNRVQHDGCVMSSVQYEGCVMSLVQHYLEAGGLEVMIKSIANINVLNSLLIKKAEADYTTSAH